MTKYVIGCADTTLVITTNRADAEEFILSCVEEDAYDDYIYGCWDSYEQYIERWKMDYYSSAYKYLTLWGYMSTYYGRCYWIDEVKEI